MVRSSQPTVASGRHCLHTRRSFLCPVSWSVSSKCERSFLSSVSWYLKALFVLKTFSSWTLVLFIRALLRWFWAWSTGDMALKRENWKTRSKACFNVTYFTTIPTWPGLGLSSGLRGEKPMSSRLRNGRFSLKLTNFGICESKEMCILFHGVTCSKFMKWTHDVKVFFVHKFRPRKSMDLSSVWYQSLHKQLAEPYVCSDRDNITPLRAAEIKCIDFLKKKKPFVQKFSTWHKYVSFQDFRLFCFNIFSILWIF